MFNFGELAETSKAAIPFCSDVWGLWVHHTCPYWGAGHCHPSRAEVHGGTSPWVLICVSLRIMLSVCLFVSDHIFIHLYLSLYSWVINIFIYLVYKSFVRCVSTANPFSVLCLLLIHFLNYDFQWIEILILIKCNLSFFPQN